MTRVDRAGTGSTPSHDASVGHGAADAHQFGNSLRAAAHRTNAAHAPPAGSSQPRPEATIDPRDARPRAPSPALPRASQRGTRRHTDTPPLPDGIALQTLLAAAHPLLLGESDDGAAPSTLTPHDVAASVTQAWMHEPSAQEVPSAERGAQWTFTLGDPLTPLAVLRISGDAAAGWGLHLTAGNGLPARELATHTERLRRRLRARGQAVDRLEVDDDPQR